MGIVLRLRIILAFCVVFFSCSAANRAAITEFAKCASQCAISCLVRQGKNAENLTILPEKSGELKTIPCFTPKSLTNSSESVKK